MDKVGLRAIGQWVDAAWTAADNEYTGFRTDEWLEQLDNVADVLCAGQRKGLLCFSCNAERLLSELDVNRQVGKEARRKKTLASAVERV